MNEEIAEFPSVTLYRGELISPPEVASRTLLDLPTIAEPDSDDAKEALESPVVFFDTAGCEFYERTESDEGSKRIGEGSKSNENEATVVEKWARKLVREGFGLADIRWHSAFPPARSASLFRTRRRCPFSLPCCTQISQR